MARRYEGTAEDDEGPVVDPREEFESADLRAESRALIPTLPPVYREVLASCVVEELTCGEADGVIDEQLPEWAEEERQQMGPPGMEAAQLPWATPATYRMPVDRGRLSGWAPVEFCWGRAGLYGRWRRLRRRW